MPRALSLGRLCLLFSSLLGLACSTSAVEGELGQGHFRYTCLDDTDAACAQAGEATSFPGTLALSSDFALTFEPSSGGKSSSVVFPASTDFVTLTDKGFHAVQAGTVAMLARTAQGSGVADFIHVPIAAVRTLGLSDADNQKPLPSLTLFRGERQRIRAKPFGDGESPLAGSLVYTWSSDAADVAAVVASASGTGQTAPSSVVEVVAKTAGTAHVAVTVPGLATPVTIEIVVPDGASGQGGQGGLSIRSPGAGRGRGAPRGRGIGV